MRCFVVHRGAPGEVVLAPSAVLVISIQVMMWTSGGPSAAVDDALLEQAEERFHGRDVKHTPRPGPLIRAGPEPGGLGRWRVN